MPAFRTNADGSLVCPHRDLSVCPPCAMLPNVREVYGAYFLMTDTQYAQLLARLS